MSDRQTKLIGVDESGMGALAGPITAAAVHIPPDVWERVQAWGWKDSKRLTPEERATLVERLKAEGPKLGVVWTVYNVEPVTIDVISPRDAWLRATRSAAMMTMLKLKCSFSEISLLVDGKEPITILPTNVRQAAIPKADRLHLPVMIASVLASYHGHQDMLLFDKLWPAYNFRINRGYPTLEHLTVLLKVGPVYGVHRKHYLRKALLAHFDRYMHHVMQVPQWLLRDRWLRNVEDGNITIETTWPVINPDDLVYLENDDDENGIG